MGRDKPRCLHDCLQCLLVPLLSSQPVYAAVVATASAGAATGFLMGIQGKSGLKLFALSLLFLYDMNGRLFLSIKSTADLNLSYS